MRSTVHQQVVSSSRSLALQQYDEAKKSQQQAVAVGSSRPTRAAAPTATVKPAAAETIADADWDLCGWQDEPSVPPAAVAAAIKLAKHQHALSPAQLSSPQQTPPACSKRVSSGGSSRRTTGPGAAASPIRRQTQGTAAQRSSRTLKQPQRPAGRTLHLGEEDSFGTAAEHFRPPDVASTPAADAEPADAGAGAGDAAAGGAETSTSIQEQPSTQGMHGSSGACCHLPSVPCGQQQQSQGQQQGDKATPRGAAAATGLFQGLHRVDAQQTCTTGVGRMNTTAGLKQTADGDESDEGLDNSLYAPRNDSRGTAGLLLPSAISKSLLPSPSSSVTCNSNILALQQRLLLPQPGIGMFGGKQVSNSTSASTSSTAVSSTFPAGALAAAARPRSASRQNSNHRRGAGGAAGQQAAVVPAFSLHARMASTAARAQLLLCRELNSLVPPPAPRARPEAAAPDAAAGPSPSAACASQRQQPEQQALPGQQQIGELDAGASSLRFVTSNGRGCSRPSSAAKRKSSSSGLAPAGVNSVAHASVAWDRPTSSYSFSESSGSSAAAGLGSTAAGTSSRRPVSASVGGAARWGSCSGSESGSSGRPSTSGSVLGSLTAGAANLSGNSSALCQSKGLSAAAEYMACRATVGELLQRINSQKAAGVGPCTRSPATNSGGAGTAAAASPVAAGDVMMSRDGRPAGFGVGPSNKAAPGRPTGLTPSSSLKAYQAFQSNYSLAGTSSTTVGSSQPCLLKSISSGASMSVSGLNISTNALELRSNAALRKCSSSK